MSHKEAQEAQSILLLSLCFSCLFVAMYLEAFK